MTSQAIRFPVFILVSLIVFCAIIWYVLHGRRNRPSYYAIGWVSVIVVVGGMVFAKLTQNAGWPWWIYYTIPAAVTLVWPPLTFRLSWHELWRYLVLAFLSSPVIDVVFSFFVGWDNYMPFIHTPSLWSLIR